MWFKKLFGLSESEASSKTLPLKTITYRGGVVSFAIPADWVEEYDEDGGGTFYENRRDSGTLRLNVLTFEAENDNASLDIDDYAHAKAERTGAKVITLDEGNALVRYDRTTVEDREKITIRYWEVYNAAPPRHVRIAILLHITFVAIRERTTSRGHEIIGREHHECPICLKSWRDWHVTFHV